ncbi:tripartite-type tricarboxylate transporter receptor subunit TctC [Pacificibacter maritimus]|uniref:Tripartite-type tricarboxylate transporter receptor subunit TctC n=1 Tax=Pacificibacter maritimus TaxID=762213 RepID=A0A3N4U9B2_9RHOB|nr:tripartite tricarboxylate transporter substrate-binding protein [Pacificibacter maritimus]RPE66378.1 tripartite-type tricarboxylate transporter receptor subunit TctC [Pacificibacter maritimus]
MTSLIKRTILSAALFCAAPIIAAAETINLVVPFPGGEDGFIEVISRYIAEDIDKNTELTVNFIEEAGAERGPFDIMAKVSTGQYEGPTVLTLVNDMFLAGPFVAPETKANPFQPLGSILTFPVVLVAPSSSPYLNFETMADVHFDQTLKLGYLMAEAGSTSQTRAAARYFDFGFDLATPHETPTCDLLQSGRVDVMVTMPELVQDCEDDVRMILALTSEPHPLLPDVETVADIIPPLAMSVRLGYYVTDDFPEHLRPIIKASIEKTLQSERAQALAKEKANELDWTDQQGELEKLRLDAAAMGKIQTYLN